MSDDVSRETGWEPRPSRAEIRAECEKLTAMMHGAPNPVAYAHSQIALLTLCWCTGYGKRADAGPVPPFSEILEDSPAWTGKSAPEAIAERKAKQRMKRRLN